MTTWRGANSRNTKAASAYIDQQLKVGRVSFPLSRLMEETGLKLEAAKGQLRRLGPRVVRIPRTHSFFLIVTPEHLDRGGPPPEWWLDDYFSWLKHPYYLALQSAAGTHGSNPQAIQVTQVMTDTPRGSIEVGRMKIVFFVKRRINETPTQQLENAFAPTRVSPPAVTAFDLVRYAPRIGGIGRVVETLRPLLPLIRGPELRAVLTTENETATAQRLGYLLEKTGQTKLADVVAGWLSGRRRPLTPLIPAAVGRPAPPVTPRWRIFDNSGEFTQ